jgi:hypothetical protein
MEFSTGGYIPVNWKPEALLQATDPRNIGISVILNYLNILPENFNC